MIHLNKQTTRYVDSDELIYQIAFSIRMVLLLVYILLFLRAPLNNVNFVLNFESKDLILLMKLSHSDKSHDAHFEKSNDNTVERKVFFSHVEAEHHFHIRHMYYHQRLLDW